MVLQFCYLRVYSGIETVSCRLLLWMARIGLDWNVKNGAYFLRLMLCLHKSPKHSTLIVLPDKICQISSL